MSTLSRLRATRLTLYTAIVLRALLWGAATAAAAWLLASWARPDWDGTAWQLAAAVLAGVVVAAGGLLRAGGWPSLLRVALWVEERIPSLGYSLVTAADERCARGPDDGAHTSVSWSAPLRRAVGRALLPPLAALSLAIAALALLPSSSAGRSGIAAVTGDDPRRAVSPGLAGLAVTVTPPAYTGLPAATLDDPSFVPGLVGSTVVVRGSGDAGQVAAVLGDTTLEVRGSARAWSATLRMPPKAAVLRLRRGGTSQPRDRLLALEPRPDSEPVVTLRAPVRDSVLRAGTGSMHLAADARDDLGLIRGTFEYIISSGSGETFSFRTGTIGARALAGTRGRLGASLSLAAMKLAAGDVIHVRALASDGNAVAGPATGRSETRSWRVARADEYDSVSVDAAAPAEADKSLVSQRMLIQLTEALQARRLRLTREVVGSESGRIAADQARLRKAVGNIIFSRLGRESGGEDSHDEPEPDGPLSPDELLAAAERAAGHDASEPTDFAGGESPVVQVNMPLLEAYNAMWEAGRELQIGEPGLALPPMRQALAAIQRARQAERIYLRGRPPAVVIDVGRARLQGKERGAPAARAARNPIDVAARRRAARLLLALDLLRASPAAAVDSLLLLRVEAIAEAPALAAALGDAIEALRAGRDAAPALALARRRVLREPVTAESLALWGRGW